jgi:hypothetical protein
MEVGSIFLHLGKRKLVEPKVQAVSLSLSADFKPRRLHPSGLSLFRNADFPAHNDLEIRDIYARENAT